jgi:hypothetical protein
VSAFPRESATFIAVSESEVPLHGRAAKEVQKKLV